MQWSWLFFISFFVLAIVDIRFALAGFLCMILPLFQSLRGKGRMHCMGYCPRGSFLKNALDRLSLKRPLPGFMKRDIFKHLLFAVMMAFFAFSLYMTNGNPALIGMAVLRMVIISSIVAVGLGIFYQPRTWCTICPMGHASKIITEKKRDKARKEGPSKKEKAA